MRLEKEFKFTTYKGKDYVVVEGAVFSIGEKSLRCYMLDYHENTFTRVKVDTPIGTIIDTGEIDISKYLLYTMIFFGGDGELIPYEDIRDDPRVRSLVVRVAIIHTELLRVLLDFENIKAFIRAENYREEFHPLMYN